MSTVGKDSAMLALQAHEGSCCLIDIHTDHLHNLAGACRQVLQAASALLQTQMLHARLNAGQCDSVSVQHSVAKNQFQYMQVTLIYKFGLHEQKLLSFT